MSSTGECVRLLVCVWRPRLAAAEMTILSGWVLSWMLLCNTLMVSGQLLQPNSVHRTPGAERPANDLWCFRCQTMESGDRCSDLTNHTAAFSHKCKDDKERLCMVKKFSYTTSNENSTSTQKTWALERNCTKHCEPGCIIIGERTKLYACTSCCDSNLCNNGTGGAGALFRLSNIRPFIMANLVLLEYLYYSQSSHGNLLHLSALCLTSVMFMGERNLFQVL